ncbi:SRPBCC family protein [Nocardioides salsibiostraticola]
MSTNQRTIKASPSEVWDVLADGWLYPLFVVGASRMREVDRTWPAIGAKLHHSVGAWPMLINDKTEVLECDPHRQLVLRAHAWPSGAARVVLTLETDPTEPNHTRVTIEEDVESGPGRLIPKPARDVQLAWRNVETLRRLAYVAERRP